MLATYSKQSPNGIMAHAVVGAFFFFNLSPLVKHHVQQVILACLTGGTAAFPLLDLVVDDVVHPLHQPCHPPANTLEVSRRHRREEVGHVRAGCEHGGLVDDVAHLSRRRGVKVAGEHGARQEAEGGVVRGAADVHGGADRRVVGDEADEPGHCLAPEMLRDPEPRRREELAGAQPPQRAPPAARGKAEHGVVAVAGGAHGVADGPGGDVGVVPLQDLTHRRWGRGDDGEHGAEAERHERRIVPRGEARHGAVREVVQLVEVADQRERQWAWRKAPARVVEELEGIGGEDDEQEDHS